MNRKNNVISEIKNEDKKSRGKFIFITLLSALGGGMIGILLVCCTKHGKQFSEFAGWLRTTLMHTSSYLVFFISIVTIFILFLFYRQARKLYATWDEENEETLTKIESKLSIALICINLETILFFLCSMIWFTSLTYAIASNSFNQILAQVGFYFAGFFLMMFSQIIGQQKIINFEKEMNPEKKGSIYDFKFQRKWLESCDEAQKMMIYQAGYASYQAVNKLCMILMLCNMIGIMLWNWGMVPAFMIAIIWTVSLLSYAVKANQLQN